MKVRYVLIYTTVLQRLMRVTSNSASNKSQLLSFAYVRQYNMPKTTRAQDFFGI